MRARIGVVGSNMVDLVTYTDRVPMAGETLAGRTFAMVPGGKGANQAVAAARLGADVTLVSRVGDDMFGETILRGLRAANVNTRHVRPVPGTPNGIATIFVEPSGENRIVIVKGANEHLTPADVEAAAPDLKDCSLILLQLEIPMETTYQTIAWAAREGAEVLLNPAPAVQDLDLARIAQVTFLVPNQTELAILTGMPVETRAEVEAAARKLVARGIKAVIVTLGAEGALLVREGPAVHVPSVRVTPVDTVGAGDAFIGAFAQHYARTRDIVAAIECGVCYAADSITRPGTQNSYADADAFARFVESLPG